MNKFYKLSFFESSILLRSYFFFVMLSCGVGVYSEDENDEEEEEAKKGTVIYFHAQPKSSDCEFSLKSIARKEEFKAGDWAGK